MPTEHVIDGGTCPLDPWRQAVRSLLPPATGLQNPGGLPLRECVRAAMWSGGSVGEPGAPLGLEATTHLYTVALDTPVAAAACAADQFKTSTRSTTNCRPNSVSFALG